MDRDTKIGLVLALAFVGLVGVVLYHKMENPETLHAVTPPVVVAQGTPPNSPPPPTPPQEQPPAGDAVTKANSEEPPPLAPPTNPAPAVTPVENKSGPGRIVINNAPPPSESSSWWPVKQTDQGAVAKNDNQVAPPALIPPGPSTVSSRQEPPAHVPPTQPTQPVAKKEGGWFHFLHREKKQEPAKPTGLTFDQPPALLPPAKPPEPQGKDIVLHAPPKQDNGSPPPGPPSAPSESTPVMIFPEKKPETPLTATLPEKKTEAPLFPPQPPSEPTITAPPTQPPVVKNEQPPALTPPGPPVNIQPPVVRNETPPSPPVTPVVNQKETKPDTPPTDVKPLPPSNSFDHRFPPSVTLGQPKVDNKPPSHSSQGNTEGSIVGQPVIIRRQDDKDLPPAREGIPVVTRPGAVITKEYPRPQVQVTATEIRSYTPKQGETYATISRLLYGHEKYEAALAQFNKERNSRLASVWPGEKIFYPSSKEYLERKYPNLIGTSVPRSPLDASGPTSKYMPPGDIQTAEAKVSQPPKNPITAAGVGATVPATNKNGSTGPRYRVRPNDSLYSIAAKTLGKGDRWNEIYALNKDALRDLNQPEVGLLLKLPADAKVDTAATPE